MAGSDHSENLDTLDPDGTELKLVDVSTEEFASEGISDRIPLEEPTLDYEGKKIDNIWYIDVRFNHVPKEPEHYIVLYPVNTEKVPPIAWPLRRRGSEKLPGMSFFPNTLQEAVPVIARCLLINLYFGRAPGFKPFTPWKVTTWNQPLATALSNHFKRLGLRRSCGLCSIGIAEEAIRWQCQRLYVNSFQNFAQGCYPGIPRGVVGNHADITFDLQAHPMPPIPDDSEKLNPVERLDNLVKQYCALLERAEPPHGPEIYIPQEINAERRKRAVLAYHAIAQRPQLILKVLAERGDADACLEYAARLLIGLQCVRNRSIAREYLLKAAYSDRASKKVKATAHGLLTEWYVEYAPIKTQARYIYAASYHCNKAAAFCRQSQPEGTRSSEIVLEFMRVRFWTTAQGATSDLLFLFPDAIRASKERQAEVKAHNEYMVAKRQNNPIRYRCAAAECPIEATKASRLLRCGGRCDTDKKPSYCSKECQKTDWKHHKSFCRPGAPSSVFLTEVQFSTDNQLVGAAPSLGAVNGALQIPINFPDGETTVFTSLTMTPARMKAYKKLAEEKGMDCPDLKKI